MMQKVSRKQFVVALKELDKRGLPSSNIRKFLISHYKADGRVSTMTTLAKAAGYKNFGGVNFQYGGLARQIAEILKVSLPKTRTFYRQSS